MHFSLCPGLAFVSTEMSGTPLPVPRLHPVPAKAQCPALEGALNPFMR